MVKNRVSHDLYFRGRGDRPSYFSLDVGLRFHRSEDFKTNKSPNYHDSILSHPLWRKHIDLFTDGPRHHLHRSYIRHNPTCRAVDSPVETLMKLAATASPDNKVVASSPRARGPA